MEKGAWLAPAVLKVGQGCHFFVQRLWATHSLSGLSQPLLVPPTISHFPAFFLLLQTLKPDEAAKMQTELDLKSRGGRRKV